MRKERLDYLILQGASVRQIAATEGTSSTNARYWLRKYKLKTRRGPHGKLPKDHTTPRKCSCGETDPTKFYGNKTTVCSTCHSSYTVARGQKQRARALQYKGGACILCGFSRYSAALDFHHKDPARKDPSFGSMRGWSWERIQIEIDACVILCKCCHAAYHAGQLQESF